MMVLDIRTVTMYLVACTQKQLVVVVVLFALVIVDFGIRYVWVDRNVRWIGHPSKIVHPFSWRSRIDLVRSHFRLSRYPSINIYHRREYKPRHCLHQHHIYCYRHDRIPPNLDWNYQYSTSIRMAVMKWLEPISVLNLQHDLWNENLYEESAFHSKHKLILTIMDIRLMISLPQPVVTHSSADELAGSNSFSSMQIGPMCLSKFKLLSKCKRAMSLSKLVGWYAGCNVILETRFVWNGNGSSVVPNFHSPALIKTSDVRKLVSTSVK